MDMGSLLGEYVYIYIYVFEGLLGTPSLLLRVPEQG